MWKPWFCWRRKPSKSKCSGVLRRKCRCAFVGDWGEICFRLLWWGKENERFGKRLEFCYFIMGNLPESSSYMVQIGILGSNIKKGAITELYQSGEV